MVLNVYKQLSIVKPPASNARPAPPGTGDTAMVVPASSAPRTLQPPRDVSKSVSVRPERQRGPRGRARARDRVGTRATAHRRAPPGAALDRTNHSALVLVMPILRIPSCTVFLKINTHGECSRTRCEPHTLCCHCSAIPTVTGNAEVRGPYDHHRVQVKRA